MLDEADILAPSAPSCLIGNIAANQGCLRLPRKGRKDRACLSTILTAAASQMLENAQEDLVSCLLTAGMYADPDTQSDMQISQGAM